MKDFFQGFIENTDLQTITQTDFKNHIAGHFNLHGSFYLPLTKTAGKQAMVMHLRIDKVNGHTTGDVFRKEVLDQPNPKPDFSIVSESYLGAADSGALHASGWDRVVYVLCDVFMSTDDGQVDAAAHDKAVLRFCVSDSTISDTVIAKLDARGEEDHAIQDSGHRALRHWAFRRMVFEYDLGFADMDGGGGVAAGHSGTIQNQLRALLGDGIRDHDGLPVKDRDIAQRYVENALGKLQIEFKGKQMEPEGADVIPELRFSAPAMHARYGGGRASLTAAQTRLEPRRPTATPAGTVDAPSPAAADPYLGLRPWRYAIHFAKQGMLGADGPSSTIARTIGFADTFGATPVRSKVIVYLDTFLQQILPPGGSVAADWNFDDPEHVSYFRRHMVFALMHETGHLLNIHHPWNRDIGNCTEMFADPDELSWLSYGQIYPKGAIGERVLAKWQDAANDDATRQKTLRIKLAKRTAFYRRFFAERAAYASEEIKFIHNAPYLHIAPGMVDLGACGQPALEIDDKNDTNVDGHKLLLEVDKAAHEIADFAFNDRTEKVVQLWNYPTKPERPFSIGFEPLHATVSLTSGKGMSHSRNLSFQTGALRLLVRWVTRSGTVMHHVVGPDFFAEIAAEEDFTLSHAMTMLADSKIALPLPPIARVPAISGPDRFFDFQVVYSFAPGRILRSNRARATIVDADRIPDTPVGEALRQLLAGDDLIQLHYAIHETGLAIRPDDAPWKWISRTLALIDKARPLIEDECWYHWITELEQQFHMTAEQVRNVRHGLEKGMTDPATAYLSRLPPHLRQSIEANVINIEAELLARHDPPEAGAGFFAARDRVVAKAIETALKLRSETGQSAGFGDHVSNLISDPGLQAQIKTRQTQNN